MPVYEFYCGKCNTIYSFFSRRVNTDTIPDCPKNEAHSLVRRVSRFAVLSQSRESDEADRNAADLPLDEHQLMRAMSTLENDLGGVDESDPRSLAGLMRKFASAAGMEYGEKMEDMIQRLERGEDPDGLEEEMGELGDDADIMDFIRRKQTASGRKSPPRIDDTLYEM
jgi:putative FmdB family regulatory protein